MRRGYVASSWIPGRRTLDLSHRELWEQCGSILDVIWVRIKRARWDFPDGPVAQDSMLPYAGGLGWIPGWGTRSHIPSLKTLHATKEDQEPSVTTKTQSSQTNKIIFLKRAAASFLCISQSFVQSCDEETVSSSLYASWGQVYGRQSGYWSEEQRGWFTWRLEGAVWIWAEHGFHLPKEW